MSIDSITSYLAIAKNEQSAIDSFAKSDTATKQGVATLTKKAPTLTTPASVLSDPTSLGVLLQAFNLSADASQTAVIKDLITQNPTSLTSLAVTSNNNNFSAFAKFMAPVSSVVVGLPPTSNLSLNTTGSSASRLTVQNTAYTAGSSAQNVGKQWSFVLNDGTANASVAAALEAAAGPGATYTINPDGSVTLSAGSPPVTVTKDSVGDAVYTLALAADSSGNTTRQLSVVSVPVTSGDSAAARGNQVGALVTALQTSGFGATQNTDGSLTVTGQSIDATANASTTAGTVIPGASGIASAGTSTSSSVIAFGGAGVGLQPGQVVKDGSTVLGTIKSVDSQGNITLTAPAPAAVAKGDYLTVDPLASTGVAHAATAATLSNVKFSATAAAATPVGDKTLALGSATAGLQPGQVLMDGGNPVGTIQSVASDGTVTLAQGSQSAVAAGDTITAAVAAVGQTTPALQDTASVATAIKQYETNQYEQSQSLSNPGMQSALYFTRSMANVTSVNQLMADPTLLSVVTASLGLNSDQFGSLNFDQQYRIISQGVNITKFQNPSYVKQVAEQYLIYEQANAPTPIPTGTLTLFGSGSDAGQTMLNIIGGQTSTTSSTQGSPLLSLFG